MKCKLLTLVVVITAVFIFRLSFMKDKIDDFEIVYEQVEVINHKIYYYNDTKLVYIEHPFDNEIKVDDIFNLLTNKSNSIKEDYDTKLVTSTKLIDYEIESNIITINLSEEFMRFKEDNCFEIYSQLQHSFSNIGFTNLIIKVENIKLDNIGFINISNGIPLSNI